LGSLRDLRKRSKKPTLRFLGDDDFIHFHSLSQGDIVKLSFPGGKNLCHPPHTKIRLEVLKARKK
jgi:hypothetical protein